MVWTFSVVLAGLLLDEILQKLVNDRSWEETQVVKAEGLDEQSSLEPIEDVGKIAVYLGLVWER